MKKITILYTIAYVVVGLMLLSGAILIWDSNTTLDRKVEEEEEAKKPAEIELTLISPVDCEQCVDGNLILQSIEKLDVRILDSQSFTSDSEDAKALIEFFGITRVPAVLIAGEYNKENVKATFDALEG
ncbi:hypothetical protein HQ524_01705 [Candidatus Uhrbacteria bacterium]|nr:hypothetical protein [Candidatus Uhrbacteria bacterium]